MYAYKYIQLYVSPSFFPSVSICTIGTNSMVMNCKYEYFKVKTINELRHAAHYKWSSTGRLPKIVHNVKVAAELIILKGYLGQKFLQNNP